ncbi:unnamed protein product [Heterobilharzia americana]|nr:unnamed protein product [Heterobilharzia americana]
MIHQGRNLHTCLVDPAISKSLNCGYHNVFSTQGIMPRKDFGPSPSSFGYQLSYCNLSPPVSHLDHQVVAKMKSSPVNGLLKDQSVTQKTILNSTFGPDLYTEGDGLFSFEVDTNILPSELLNKNLDDPDFDWTDLLPDSSEPVSLEDISPSHFLNYEINKEAGVLKEGDESNNCQNNSLTNFDLITSKPCDKSRIVQQKPTSSSSSTSAHCLSSSDNTFQPSDFMESNDDFDIYENLQNGKPGQQVKFSLEECKMLQELGCRLPMRFPLSPADEKAIRTVRRKIRNKISAQASRAKRQKYVLDLERRYALCTEENKQLRRYIYELQEDKRSLTLHLRKLRSYLNKFMSKQNEDSYLPLLFSSNCLTPNKHVSARKAATAAGGTSLLVMTFMVLMWTALVPLPSNTKNFETTSPLSAKNLLTLLPGRSRTLMSINSEQPSSQDVLLNESKNILLDPNLPENPIDLTVPLNDIDSSVRKDDNTLEKESIHLRNGNDNNIYTNNNSDNINESNLSEEEILSTYTELTTTPESSKSLDLDISQLYIAERVYTS